MLARISHIDIEVSNGKEQPFKRQKVVGYSSSGFLVQTGSTTSAITCLPVNSPSRIKGGVLFTPFA